MSWLYLFLVVTVVACGDVILSTRDLPQQVQGNFLAEVVPPVDYYRQRLVNRFHNMEQQENNSRQFFINFQGGPIEQGVGARQSFLLCQQRTTVPATSFDHDAQMIVIGAIADFFTKHKLNNPPQIAIDRPQRGEYSTVYVGGSYHEVLGCRGEKKNILGHAPTDDGDINPVDVGFVFDEHGDGDLLLRAIAHIIGRMSGLPVTNRSDEVMSLTMSAVTPLRFSSQTLATREVKRSSSNGSHLAGHDFLVTLAKELSETDEDDQDLSLSLVVERLRVGVPDSVETPGLERVLAVLLPKDNRDKISFKGILGQIARKTVAKKFGNTPASILDAILSRNNKGNKNSSQELLDFSHLLELNQIDRLAELFPMLDQQLALTNKITITADDRQSLHSVLKVGYFQRLTEISR